MDEMWYYYLGGLGPLYRRTYIPTYKEPILVILAPIIRTGYVQ